MTNNENTPRKRSRPIGFHPIRTIVFLGLLVLILLYFIMLFGLGSGGGKTWPGSSDSADVQVVDPSETEQRPVDNGEIGVISSETEPSALSGTEKPVVRRELMISFIPSESDPDTAVESACQLHWIDPRTGRQVSQNVAAENKADFEFALEKAIRTWRTSLQSQTMINVPVLAIQMTPFPGEGTFQKINELVKNVDSQINILRLESTSTKRP